MAKLMEVPFAKYQAVGNDFVVVSASKFFLVARRTPHILLTIVGAGPQQSLWAIALARSICHRQMGVGADGLLVILPPGRAGHHARMFVFNADGSEAEMSGNGIRCAAAYLLERGGQGKGARSAKPAKRLTSPRALRIETGAGLKSLRIIEAEETCWVFRVGMGKPILAPGKIPFNGADAGPVVGFPLPVRGGTVEATVTSMGNPHCSVFVEDFDAVDWPEMGRAIEGYQIFPNRTNVEFIRVLSRTEIEVRFWERGVGKTQSSGTGSCAAVVACILNRRTARKVRVRTLAGTLEVAWPENGEVSLTGPVELVARGTYYLTVASAVLKADSR
ncbi:MAG TPA: diaminopimelate epimerase [Terriglobia bacterium]|nr:diaminopimelate epimerase [Terriglobia bacterium]